MIGYSQHLDKYGDLYADWDPASRSDVQQSLASITKFEFIVVFLSMYQYLSHIAGIIVKLQKKTVDIVDAYQMVSEVAKTYKDQRKDVDASFSLIFTQSTRMAEKVGAAVEMPRITSRQKHRSNAEALSPQEYLKKNVVIPFLDHIIMCLDQQFSPAAIIPSSLLALVPSILCSKNPCLETVARMYI